MLEIDGFFAFVVFGLWLYCIYDVITTEEVHIRNLPKMVWLFIVIFLFDIGALAWLLLGRPQNWQFAKPPGGRAAGTTSTSSRPAGQSPLDDPDLSGMNPIVREREEAARMKLWEEQLKRREDEIRRRELGLGPRRNDDGPTS